MMLALGSGLELAKASSKFESPDSLKKGIDILDKINDIQLIETVLRDKKDAAEKAKLKAEKLKADYENFIKAEHRTTSLWMDEERKKISEEEHRITQAARDDVGEKLNGLRKQINTDIEKARADLSPLISDFASRIASKLVGKTVSIAGIDSDLKKNLNNRPVVQG